MYMIGAESFSLARVCITGLNRGAFEETLVLTSASPLLIIGNECWPNVPGPQPNWGPFRPVSDQVTARQQSALRFPFAFRRRRRQRYLGSTVGVMAFRLVLTPTPQTASSGDAWF